MDMTITPVYAALLALLFVGLSVRTVLLRQRFRVQLGDGGHPELQRAIRVHGNFAEYVPLTLLLIFMLEWISAWDLLVHVFCLMLIAGRLIHAYGVGQVRERHVLRVAGMSLTFLALAGAALSVLLVEILRWLL